MLIGHFALGLAAKRLTPQTPLGLLLLAPFLSDLVFPIFVLLGWEQMRVLPEEHGFLTLELVSLPYSHSLMAGVGWALLLALPYFLWRRDGRGALMLAALVLSHWVLDTLTHRPDMAVLVSGGPKLGLGLWHSLAGTFVVEGVLFAFCLWLYVSGTRATGRSGDLALWGLIGLLVVSYLGFALGPPLPSGEAVAYLTLTSWVVPIWAQWIDRHRAFALPLRSDLQARPQG
jgi:hypothetical protein